MYGFSAKAHQTTFNENIETSHAFRVGLIPQAKVTSTSSQGISAVSETGDITITYSSTYLIFLDDFSCPRFKPGSGEENDEKLNGNNT